jgi:hypothetical protein
MDLPECIATIRRYTEGEADLPHVIPQTTAPWAVASTELSEVLEDVVICASNCTPDSLQYVVEDYESVVETLDDLAPILYRPHITLTHALLLAHSGRFAEADHTATDLLKLLEKRQRKADATWGSTNLVDIALTEAVKGRILDWSGHPSKSMVRYKAALNAVRQSEKIEFQTFVHGLYYEAAFRDRRIGLAMHIHAVQRQLREHLPGQRSAILDRRLWQRGLASRR